MTITPKQLETLINNGNITMMFYFAGTGGDFLSQLIANNSSDFNDLAYTAYENNRFASVPIFNRISDIKNPEFISDWINLDYFNMNHEIDYNKRIMVQDHYDDIVLDRIKKISKHIDAVFLDCGKSIRKYVELFLRKRHTEANVNGSFRKFLENRVTRNIENQNKIIKAVQKFDTVCLQDLCNFNNELNSGIENPTFIRRTKDEIFKEEMEHLTGYYYRQTEKLFNIKNDFKSFNVINIDALDGNSEMMVLENIRNVFKNFNIENASPDYKLYVENNKKLLSNLSVSLWQSNTDIGFEDIKNANPVLLVYPAGTGGEHVAHTLSLCNPDFEELVIYKDEELNVSHTQCFLNYSSNINFDDIRTMYNPGYRGNFVDNKKRIVLKDHPTNSTLNFYSKYLPDIKIIYIYPKKEIEYFANLTFKKLARRVETPVSQYYIKKYIKETATLEEIEKIQTVASHYDWVWLHELHTFVANGYSYFIHNPDLSVSIGYHKYHLDTTYKSVRWKYGKAFRNIHYVLCDTLISDSSIFWECIGNVIPNTDVSKATVITNKWIEKNNSLNLPEQDSK